MRMSHELRTPLAAITASAETLRRGVADVKIRAQFIGIIDRHSKKLCFLMDDLLSVAELELGKVLPQPIAVDVRSFTLELIRSCKQILVRTGAGIDVDIAESLYIWIDPAHLTRIFADLIGSVLKTKSMGSRVLIEGRRIGGHQARISFRSTADRREPADRGAGLSLYIVNALVETNGGRLWAERDNGPGSGFRVELPLRPPPPRA